MLAKNLDLHHKRKNKINNKVKLIQPMKELHKLIVQNQINHKIKIVIMNLNQWHNQQLIQVNNKVYSKKIIKM